MLSVRSQQVILEPSRGQGEGEWPSRAQGRLHRRWFSVGASHCLSLSLNFPICENSAISKVPLRFHVCIWVCLHVSVSVCKWIGEFKKSRCAHVVYGVLFFWEFFC